MLTLAIESGRRDGGTGGIRRRDLLRIVAGRLRRKVVRR